MCAWVVLVCVSVSECGCECAQVCMSGWMWVLNVCMGVFNVCEHIQVWVCGWVCLMCVNIYKCGCVHGCG